VRTEKLRAAILASKTLIFASGSNLDSERSFPGTNQLQPTCNKCSTKPILQPEPRLTITFPTSKDDERLRTDRFTTYLLRRAQLSRKRHLLTAADTFLQTFADARPPLFKVDIDLNILLRVEKRQEDAFPRSMDDLRLRRHGVRRWVLAVNIAGERGAVTWAGTRVRACC